MKSFARTYTAVLNPNEEGGFDVSFPDFPGCVTFGRTLKEAQTKAKEVLELWLEELESNNTPLPKHKSPPIFTEVKV